MLFHHQILLLLLLSRFSRVRLCVTPQMAAHQAPPPWDSPGKNTGVGCHFLLQRMKVKSESEVAQSCPTLSDPVDCSLPGSSTHGIFQARVLEWGAIAFSGSFEYININTCTCFCVYALQQWLLKKKLSILIIQYKFKKSKRNILHTLKIQYLRQNKQNYIR